MASSKARSQCQNLVQILGSAGSEIILVVIEVSFHDLGLDFKCNYMFILRENQ